MCLFLFCWALFCLLSASRSFPSSLALFLFFPPTFWSDARWAVALNSVASLLIAISYSSVYVYVPLFYYITIYEYIYIQYMIYDSKWHCATVLRFVHDNRKKSCSSRNWEEKLRETPFGASSWEKDWYCCCANKWWWLRYSLLSVNFNDTQPNTFLRYYFPLLSFALPIGYPLCITFGTVLLSSSETI